MTVEERSLRSEIIFREANQAIDRNRLFDSDDLLTFLCECGNVSCGSDVELTTAEYAAVRRNTRQFVLAIGHDDGLERVVDEFDRYSVVEKAL